MKEPDCGDDVEVGTSESAPSASNLSILAPCAGIANRDDVLENELDLASMRRAMV